MTIHLDESERSIVVWCDCCPTFAEVCASRVAALREARDHERDQHPDQHSRQSNYARDTRPDLVFP